MLIKEWLGVKVLSDGHFSYDGHAEHAAIALIPTLARRNLSPSLHVLLPCLLLRTTAVVDRSGPRGWVALFYSWILFGRGSVTKPNWESKGEKMDGRLTYKAWRCWVPMPDSPTLAVLASPSSVRLDTRPLFSWRYIVLHLCEGDKGSVCMFRQC